MQSRMGLCGIVSYRSRRHPVVLSFYTSRLVQSGHPGLPSDVLQGLRRKIVVLSVVQESVRLSGKWGSALSLISLLGAEAAVVERMSSLRFQRWACNQSFFLHLLSLL